MTAYATVSDLALRMRTTFSQTDEAYAQFVLDEIGAYLAQLVEVDTSDSTMMANLKYASLSMAARALQTAFASDIASMTTQAGSYSETVTYAQPYATNNWWKLLKASGYAARLGLGGGIGFARPSYGIMESDDET